MTSWYRLIWMIKKQLIKVGVLRNFATFTGKHLCCRLATLLEGTPPQVFSREYCKIFKNAFFHRTPPLAASGSSSPGNLSRISELSSHKSYEQDAHEWPSSMLNFSILTSFDRSSSKGLTITSRP